MRRTWARSALCLWLASSIVLTSCGAPAPKPAALPGAQPAPVAAVADGRPSVSLSTADGGAMELAFATTAPTAAAGTVTPLDAAAAQALIARMEPLPALDNRSAPTLPPASGPPPRAGSVQPIAFVVPTGKPVGDGPLGTPHAAPLAPLTAPTILPSGEVRAESELRIRFAEPMVPLARIGDVAIPPVRVTPQPYGTWRWIDTRVLGFFATTERFAQATTYTVTVPAGTRALTGAALAEDAVGTFSTKPVAISEVFPDTLRPDSPLAVSFDAGVDRAAIVKHLTVTANGKKIAIKLVERSDANAAWKKLPQLEIKSDSIGRSHAIIAPVSGAWPASSELRVVLGVGAPSTEGPLTATRASVGTARVVAPFRLRGLECQDETPRTTGLRCGESNHITVRFSNPIHQPSYRSELVQFAGEEFQDFYMYDDNVGVWVPAGLGKRRELIVKDGLVDVYGQPLTGARSIAFVATQHVFFPWLDAETGLHVIDPRFQIPQWVVSMQAIPSVHVQLFKVTPADYFAYETAEDDPTAKLPGTLFFDKTHPVGLRHGADLRVDLRPGLTNGTGHIVAVATAPGTKQRQVAWIQVTKLGMTARHDGDKITAWTRDISPSRFLAPIANPSLAILREGSRTPIVRAQGDAAGQATLELPEAKRSRTQSIVIAEAAGDSTFTAFGRDRSIRRTTSRWYVTDDRFTYRPGESVHVKGWLRQSHDGVNPDLTAPPWREVTWTLRDARRVQIAKGSAKVSDQGGFDLEASLPTTANLGTATFSFSAGGESMSHSVAVQEFRTPAYSVALDDDVQYHGARPLIVGESIEMRSEAKYYAGGGLPGAEIRWAATLAPSKFVPANWERYTFTPSGSRGGRKERSRYYNSYSLPTLQRSEAGTLGGDSISSVSLALAETPGHVPSLLSVDATVADLDRMQIRASSRSILVHPSALYVGVRLQPGRTDVLEAIVTDIDGTPVAGVPISYEIEAVLGSEQYRDDAKIVERQQCTVVSAAAPVACPFKRTHEWAYTAVARIADARGRSNSAEYQLPWRGNRDEKRELKVIADKTSYRPGDVAKLELRSATLPATAVVTVARNGVIRQFEKQLTAAITTVELPIEAAFMTDVHVLVDRWAVKKDLRAGSTLPLPELVSEEVVLDVDLDSVRLAVTATPDARVVEPGAEASFEVRVQRDDKPVANAEVALIVVDEAILSLSARSHEDPLEPFYQRYPANAQLAQTLRYVRDQGPQLKGDPGFKRFSLDEMGERGTGSGSGFGAGYGGMAGGAGGMGSTVVEARKDFRPLAVFSPLLHTDRDGKVTVTVKMPDNLTRYRIVALATADVRWFGKGEDTIVAQRAVNARTIAPRFLTQGDQFMLPVLVQNLAPTTRQIDVAVRAGNLVASGPAAQRVTLAAGQRAELRFAFATAERGTAVIQTLLASGAHTDASNVEVPVYMPATTEAFATYGVVDDKAAFEQLAVPKNVFPDVGGVELEVSSTQLQTLTDAYWYLQAYPYECAEQRSSRMLATTALADVLEAFATPGRPTRDQLTAQRQTDVQRLVKDQLPSGGWGYFPRMGADPFVTAQVLTALGPTAPDKTRTAAITFVTAFADKQLTALATAARQPLDQRTAKTSELPYQVSAVAAALTALASAGSNVEPRVAKLHAVATTLGVYPMDAKARVLSLVAQRPTAAAIRKPLLAAILSATHETAAAAQVTATFAESERMLLVSNTKTTALALDALMREAPEHPLIVKLARGVLGGQVQGRWRTTQENLVVLATMRRYFDLYEKTEPNFRSKTWLGKAAYAELAFAGRTMEHGIAAASWDQLAPGTTHDLAITKEGPGRMYYRVGITYAPTATDLPALDAGFIVRRSYTAVDDPGDVQKLAGGRYRIKLGARVKVGVETHTTSRRFGVAVTDPLPAGLEPVNTALANAERAASTSGDSYWDHRAMRDTRGEAFSMSMSEGLHRFSYTARATTPGTFVAAPAKAEEMYSPETFGRSTGVTVVIE